MYFAIDLNKKIIVNDDGDVFSVDQFKEIMRGTGGPYDMTMMVQRFILMDYDFDKLIDFYEN